MRPLAGLLAAAAVSQTGTRVSAIALPWFVLVTTGSAARTGLVAFCEMAPYVLVKALTGPLVDRAGARVISWTTDVASAAVVAAVPLLHALGLLDFGLLLGMVAAIGAARGPGDLAKEVMIPEAAARSAVPIERATGLLGVVERLASTVGPGVGGVLVAVLGPLAGLLVNAATFALGSVIVGLALPRGMGGADDGTVTEAAAHGTAEAPDDGPPRDGPEPGYWRRFGEGFAYLRRQPLLLTIICTVGFTNFLDAARNSVLLPIWARETGYGPSVIGLMTAATGLTAVAGSLVAAVVAHRMRRRLLFFAGFLLSGAPRFVILAVDVPVWAVVAVYAASGFGAGFLNPILGAVVWERIPRRLLGRVGALGDSLAWAGIPLGGLLAGAAVGWAGLVPVLAVSGAAYFLATNLAGLRREWREMDRERTGAQGPGRTGATGPGAPEGAPAGPPAHRPDRIEKA
ncbi:MFS transporter [Streptomyces sp. Ru73]|uniref:MFS transporter n=1 Tax=Streptomyces sp. Ru73 TaxID=2080748 RepID=UPI000CDE0DB4|nr:MFS transporter [Streptomyces sp. Ru73]POX37498.1 MFS transporter [Streptomyces sp. Ru73]